MPVARRARRAKKRREDDLPRAIEVRAAYVIDVIRDEPWLDGRYLKLAAMVRERFRISRNPSEKAVTRAYDRLEEEAKARRPKIYDYLCRKYERAIEMAERDRDSRALLMATMAYQKMLGFSDGERPTGEGAASFTQDDAAMIDALRLTNAQRQAEILALEGELGEEQPSIANLKKRAATSEVALDPDDEPESDDLEHDPPPPARRYVQPLAADSDDADEEDDDA